MDQHETDDNLHTPLNMPLQLNLQKMLLRRMRHINPLSVNITKW